MPGGSSSSLPPACRLPARCCRSSNVYRAAPGARARSTAAPSRLLRTDGLLPREGAARWRHPDLSAALCGRGPPPAAAVRPDDGQIRPGRAATAPLAAALLVSVLRMRPAGDPVVLTPRLRKPLAGSGGIGFFSVRLL